MTAVGDNEVTGKPKRRGRYLFWVFILLAVTGVAFLASWLMERSLRTPAKIAAVRSWLDERLNADVSSPGEMVVRVNLLRDSRVVLHDTEIEHPNPIFPGKFAFIDRMGAWVPPWSAVGIIPGHLELLFTSAHFFIAQNESGDWSHQGLMRPLATGNVPFPFPRPAVSGWTATVRDSSLTLQRRNYEMRLSLEGEIHGRPGNDRVAIHSDALDFTFGKMDSDVGTSGSAGPVNLVVSSGGAAGELPIPVAGQCEIAVKSLPVSALPFFVTGIPMEEVPGVFHGLIRLDADEDAEGSLFMEGELADVPLGVFGLPRNAPFRLSWPLRPKKDNLEARIHMGPSGFGAFDINVQLDNEGMPRLLAMRGDAGALDDIPAFFGLYSRWPDWLSRVFPRIRWQTGTWRGFGWQGSNLNLELSRSTAGLNLNGEAGLMDGRIRISMAPDQPHSPITLAAEKLDALQLSAKLRQLLPAPFRARITGANVNLTWRGVVKSRDGIGEWGTGMVWSKPVVDLASSGAFWHCMDGIAKAIADMLPQWGGGDPESIRELSNLKAIHLDQLSIVAEKEEQGAMIFEFRAYGDAFGQATGFVERHRDGAIEGEFLLAGPSQLLAAVGKANPELAVALDLLANDSSGLRVSFRMEPGQDLVFSHPFLIDAEKIRGEMLRSGILHE